MVRVTETLSRLRRSLSRKAEDAYTARDAAQTAHAATYADGEAHAYGVAANEVREAEEDSE
ncbi:MAG: hypothetical protein QOI10_60 [Solirubrobacterales bacterium]|jgi:hypothetical protein|nr:hypothetical protein [Solirubrobacterales bacterium]